MSKGDTVKEEMVADLEAKAKALDAEPIADPKSSPESLYIHNAKLRRLHAELETAISRCGTNPALAERLGKVSQSLRLRPVPAAPFAIRLVRILLVVFFLLASAPLMTLTAATRVFHPLFRGVFGIRNNGLPLDVYQRWLCRGIVRLMGITVVVEGTEQCDLFNPSVGFFTHGSNLDPPLVAASSPITFRWIGKTQAFLIPVLGWFAFACGMIPIDRKNRDSAIKSLGQAAKSILEWGRSISVSPEGTRSPSGLLLPFKKGPFYLAGESGVDMTPAYIFGAYELWPPQHKLPTPGQVVVRFRKTAPLPGLGEGGSEGRDRALKATRELFLEELSRSPKPTQFLDSSRQTLSKVADALFIGFSCVASYLIMQGAFAGVAWISAATEDAFFSEDL